MFNFCVQAAWAKTFYPRRIAAIHNQTHPFPQVFHGLEYFISPEYWFSNVVLMHEPNADDITKSIDELTYYKQDLWSMLWICARGEELQFKHYSQKTHTLETHFSCPIAEATELATAFRGKTSSFQYPENLRTPHVRQILDANKRYTKKQLRTDLNIFDCPWVRRLKHRDLPEILSFLPSAYSKQALFRIQNNQVDLSFLSESQYRSLQEGLAPYLPDGLKSLILSPQEMDKLLNLNIPKIDLIDTLLLGFRREDAQMIDWVVYVLKFEWLLNPIRQLPLLMMEFPLACLKEWLAQDNLAEYTGEVLLSMMRVGIDALLFATRLITSPYALAQEFQTKQGLRQTHLGRFMAWYATLYTTGLLFAVFLPGLLGLEFGLALSLSFILLSQFCLALTRYIDLFSDLFPNTDHHRLLEERCFANNLGVTLAQGLEVAAAEPQKLTDKGPLQVYQTIAKAPDQSSFMPNALYFFKESGYERTEQVTKLPNLEEMQAGVIYFLPNDDFSAYEYCYRSSSWSCWTGQQVVRREQGVLDTPESKLEDEMSAEDKSARLYCLFTDANRKFHKLVNLSQDYPKLAAGSRL